MTMPWHMARVASRRQLPKPRKMHGPVYVPHAIPEGIDFVCRKCGHNMCSCDPYADYKRMRELHPDMQIVGWKYMAKGSGALIVGGDNILRMSPQDIPPEHLGALIDIKHPNGCPCQGCVPGVEVRPFSLAKAWSKHIRDHMEAHAATIKCSACLSTAHGRDECPFL